MYARSQSKEYFSKVAAMFDLTKKEDFAALEQGYKTKNLYIPKWGFNSINPLGLLCYEDMTTKT